MSYPTLTRPKPSVKRRVETWRETRQRWLATAREVFRDPETPEETRSLAARWIGELEEELQQHA